MIRADSQSANYHTAFTNGTHRSTSDTTPHTGGGNLGFRPHELLEAALATCMNMTLRMAADKQGIPLSSVSVTVSLNREEPGKPVFEYSVELGGALSEAQRSRLLLAVDTCPVRNTLSHPLRCIPCAP
jgi:putative redox protein